PTSHSPSPGCSNRSLGSGLKVVGAHPSPDSTHLPGLVFVELETDHDHPENVSRSRGAFQRVSGWTTVAPTPAACPGPYAGRRPGSSETVRRPRSTHNPCYTYPVTNVTLS